MNDNYFGHSNQQKNYGGQYQQPNSGRIIIDFNSPSFDYDLQSLSTSSASGAYQLLELLKNKKQQMEGYNRKILGNVSALKKIFAFLFLLFFINMAITIVMILTGNGESAILVIMICWIVYVVIFVIVFIAICCKGLSTARAAQGYHNINNQPGIFSAPSSNTLYNDL